MVYIYFKNLSDFNPIAAAVAVTLCRVEVLAVVAEILKFFGNYDDTRIRGQ